MSEPGADVTGPTQAGRFPTRGVQRTTGVSCWLGMSGGFRTLESRAGITRESEVVTTRGAPWAHDTRLPHFRSRPI